MLKLYHGSNSIVRRPILKEPEKFLDFGRGFYTTDSPKCAYDRAMQSWSPGRHYDGVLCFVSDYELDENAVTIKRFEGPTEEWLDTLVDSRSSGFSTDYDVLVGPIADAYVGTILSDFCLFKEEFLLHGGSVEDLRFKTEKYKTLRAVAPKKEYAFEQYVMVSQWALKNIEYKGCHVFSKSGILLKDIAPSEMYDQFRLEDLAAYRTKKQKKDSIWYER